MYTKDTQREISSSSAATSASNFVALFREGCGAHAFVPSL